MMARPRGNKKQATSSKPLHNYPDYIYRVDNIRGRHITWEVKIIKAGQLPLQQQNRPTVNIKRREELILSRKTGATKSDPLTPRTTRPGAIIHHTLRTQNQPAPIFKQGPPEIHTHHTIEKSPGYIKAMADGVNRKHEPKIIHHSLENSPASRIIKPVRIEKPPPTVVQHHTLNPKPPIDSLKPLIPPAPRPKKRNLPGGDITIRKDD